jgi:heme A synthase
MNAIVDLSAYFLQILCTLAQGFCIQFVATRNYWYEAVEETLWGVSHACLAPCVFYLLIQYLVFDGRRIKADKIDLSQTEIFLFIVFFYTIGLALFNLYHHVPILHQLANIDAKNNVKHLTFFNGLTKALTERTCTNRFFAWRNTWDW